MHKNSKSLLLASLAFFGITAFAVNAFGGENPKDGAYVVRDTNGTVIGTAGVSNGGKRVGYVDNPGTSHPPDSNAVWNDPEPDGVFTDGNGYTVEFDKLGNGYVWVKKDSNGNTVDSGTMMPTQPS